ncbi:MAG: type I DNA topoisomerase [Luteibaculaceae bacterium]
MSKNLVIVESPAKAKTIEGYLGKDFTVKSSFGHVRDLKKKGLAVNVDKSFEPEYEVSADKKKLVTELKGLAKKAEVIWLATDEDREGEAISWHLYETLGLRKDNTKRIVFNEITKPAILKAIENPRQIDIDLVNAQQARRVLDRLVGFELSPVLWRKVRPSLSAGRVQSVTVRLIVEREREIQNFVTENSFRVRASFSTSKGASFNAELEKRFDTEKEALQFLEACINATHVVESVEKKPGKKSPAAPFTTSTLQQEASRKLGYSPSQTMQIAQKLYEAGKITYMRTDSVNLSQTALNGAKDAIKSIFGENFYQQRVYSSKSKGAQEAHEAIRPTNMLQQSVDGTSGEEKLYDLIWKRTLASQMADAKVEKTTIKVSPSTSKLNFVARGEVITFEGFLKVYMESTDDEADENDDSGLLPAVQEKELLNALSIESTERFSQHPARFTEASLIKKLEELGIGRPSTYAPTVTTVIKRGYVVKEDREGHERKYKHIVLKNGTIKSIEKTEITGAEKKKLFPTDIGVVVNDFLLENFKNIMDYNFTAKIEDEFDHIAEGKLSWTQMLEEFYKPFKHEVDDTIENSAKASGERLLGEHPESKKPVYAKIGRYGPMIQIGESEAEDKPQFASVLKTQSIETITLEEALDLFKLPRTLGEFEGSKVQASVGRFGPYLLHDKKFTSIPKSSELDPLSITLDEAVELIKNKREDEANKLIKSFDKNPDVQVLNGRWGPYIKYGKKNLKIPKDVDAESLTLEKIEAIAKAEPEKKSARSKAKK